jgi:hypothetical protein
MSLVLVVILYSARKLKLNRLAIVNRLTQFAITYFLQQKNDVYSF